MYIYNLHLYNKHYDKISQEENLKGLKKMKYSIQ
ncbi:Rrf2 family transcriptional regulator, partial [Listeria monocytogenes]|nr:Rrf2 family transcriptional regulator [Listeria monocytogenes]